MLNKESIKGLYLSDGDKQEFEVTIPEGDPIAIIEQLEMAEVVLACANRRIEQSDEYINEQDLYLHILISKETFDGEPTFEIAMVIRKNNPEKIEKSQVERVG